MIRARKDVDWPNVLESRDRWILERRIDPAEWYPMRSFERIGIAILDHIAMGSVEAVRFWGRSSIDQLLRFHPELVAKKEPPETIRRFEVLRASFFNYPCVYIPDLFDFRARVAVNYQMSERAEEAAAFQTIGFFERLIELSGAKDLEFEFKQKAWEGAEESLIDLSWS